MKKVVAVVRPSKLEPLKEALFTNRVSGMTISQVHGCGHQHGWKEYVRGNEILVNMVPKVKFELVVEDDDLENVIEIIINTAQTGEVGDGKIFVSSMEEVIRIRTGERGDSAI